MLSDQIILVARAQFLTTDRDSCARCCEGDNLVGTVTHGSEEWLTRANDKLWTELRAKKESI